MKPFFPPQSPLQSRNLRAAFFRGLNSLNKNNEFLKNRLTIRRTMLDECYGEKFTEFLAVFSSLVLHKIYGQLSEVSITQKLATAPTLSAGERKSLLPLAIAHRASLVNVLKSKESKRVSERFFERSLAEKEEELRTKARALKIPDKIDAHSAEHARATYNLTKQLGPEKFRTKPRISKITDEVDARSAEHARAIAEVTKQFGTHWEGERKWKEIVLEGNTISIPDSILDKPFPKERPVIGSTAGDAPPSHQTGLSEDLDKRLEVQQAMIEDWRSFRKEFHAPTPKDSNDPSSTQKQGRKGTVTSLDRHHDLMANANDATFDAPSVRRGSVSERVDEYEKMTKALHQNLTNVDRPKGLSFSHWQGKNITFGVENQSENSVTVEASDHQPDDILGETPDDGLNAANLRVEINKDQSRVHSHGEGQGFTGGANMCLSGLQRATYAANATPPEEKSSPMGMIENFKVQEHEIQIKQLSRVKLNALSSRAKHQPSLVERTRKSMALAKAEDGAGSSVTRSDDLPPLPVRVPDSLPAGSHSKLPGRETLLERTRQSMSLLPVKLRASRTSLLKQPSKVYPTNPFETPKKSHPEMPELSTPSELFSQDADYASVFKSRPKIALSPTQSPSFGCMDVVHESTSSLFKEDDMREETVPC